MPLTRFIADLARNTWNIWVEAAPWLLVGLLVAGILRGWFPTAWVQRWLGGRGVGPVFRAAVIGTPLPLCSCSVLPAAVALRRSGASRGATVSFLISTPENGADSLAVSYVMLGPFMTIVRPIAAIISAVTAGLLTQLQEDLEHTSSNKVIPNDNPDTANSCCEPIRPTTATLDITTGLSIAPGCCANQEPPGQPGGMTNVNQPVFGFRSLVSGIVYASTDLLRDIGLWLIAGILIAAVVSSTLPAGSLQQWDGGVLPMAGMLLIGIPMYICATASTPVAAAMLVSGVSPGTVLVIFAGRTGNQFCWSVGSTERTRLARTGQLLGGNLRRVNRSRPADRSVRAMGWLQYCCSTEHGFAPGARLGLPSRQPSFLILLIGVAWYGHWTAKTQSLASG